MKSVVTVRLTVAVFVVVVTAWVVATETLTVSSCCCWVVIIIVGGGVGGVCGCQRGGGGSGVGCCRVKISFTAVRSFLSHVVKRRLIRVLPSRCPTIK